MEQAIKFNQPRDFQFKFSISLVLLCFALYYYICLNPDDEDSTAMVMFFNYGISVFYIISIFIANKRRTGKFWVWPQRSDYLFFLTLASISCFTLNQLINVFDNFSTWVDVYILIMYGGLLSMCFLDKLPYWMRVPIFFSLGMGTAMSLYFTIFLLPLMPFCLFLCFVLGLSLHLIIPFLVLLATISIFIKTEKTSNEKLAYCVGLSAPILMAILFMLQWQKTSQLIHTSYEQNQQHSQQALPSWVRLSQQLSDGFFTQRILKGEMVYSTFESNNWGFWGNLPGMSMEEKKEHDPLVAIATLFCGKLPNKLTKSDRLHILKFYSNLRHDTHRKLWTGKNLITTKINSKIQVYPEFRLAYTEKIITIKNKHHWRQEEALYSFQLPEGSVATSLSLWVNGVEEQSRLTTRGKADSAYVSIVGVERRDPALLHWQEGNRITVTVFPCTNKEDRVFKIGITSPMQLREGQLFLPELKFNGPLAKHAMYQNHVEFPTLPNMDYSLDYYGNLSCPAVDLSGQHFCFKNQTFWMEEYLAENAPFAPSFVYLDINKSWSIAEFQEICALYANQQIWVYHEDKLQAVSAQSTAIFEQLAKANFSLFPINIIALPAQSLLISKSTKKSPNLSDLKNTNFGKTMINTLSSKKEALNMYSLSYELSPYLQGLEEFYVFNYAKGSLGKLKRLANNKLFPLKNPSTNGIVFQQSNTVLYSQENVQNFESKAPDHLMRLFAYNQILKKIGKDYFQSHYENQELVNIASQANVVSPISSLIVLETKKDYERFDITEEKNGLGNASDKGIKKALANQSGAVPEPQEWLFIILTLMGLMFLQMRRI